VSGGEIIPEHSENLYFAVCYYFFFFSNLFDKTKGLKGCNVFFLCFFRQEKDLTPHKWKQEA